MFQIQEIDPKVYRTNTRNATLRIMGLFVVVGFASSYGFYSLFDDPVNPLTLQIMGAMMGLALVFWITAKYFKDKPWMAEAMYGWKLKRSLMHLTNAMRQLQEKVDANDVEAMKLMRFYHLGITQMYTLEQNTSGLIDLKVERDALEARMQAMGIDTEQKSFDLAKLKAVIGDELAAK
ncbi:DUF3087 domain-containing protein [Thiomicrospira microaerophila]|uniref:DUF3087 family protein n=1 Tax=Thiomicrospira microaerophila TaxID=406020 RepID=UPI00200F14C8|nr:DUF3087 family protein [Thiomicrospira microaerophila]UQB41255.1 DUF3087 domain-containing protein [Thiomicrospira microaerophila]